MTTTSSQEQIDLNRRNSGLKTGGLVNRSIRTKLIGGTVVIVLIIVSLLTFVLARSAADLLEKESSNQLSQLLDQSTLILSSFLETNEANLVLWSTEPLVHSVANDPALAAIFALGLNDYFETHVSNKPWIRNVVLVKDGTVVFAQHASDDLSTDTATPASANLSQLLAAPAEGLSVIRLASNDGAEDRAIVMKRPLLDEAGPKENAHIVLLLDLDTVQEDLFGQIKAGTNGFLTLAVEERSSAGRSLWVPPNRNIEGPESIEFMQAQKFQGFPARSGEEYESIVVDHRALADTPLMMIGVAATRDVFEPVTKLVLISVICGVVAIFAGGVSLFFFSGRLTAPIRELTARAHKFASSRLDPAVSSPALESGQPTPAEAFDTNGHTDFEEIDSQDEVGELSSVFRLLDQRTQELEHANSLLGKRNQEIDQAMLALQSTQDELVTNLSRLERELATARELQLSMVPSVFPPLSSTQPVDIYAIMEPAREVGGDLYDFFYADDDTICFVVGDVSDKGTSAALFMARTRSLIRYAVNQWRETTGQVPDALNIMASVNKELCQNNKARMFVTLFLGFLDVKTGVLKCSNAGHITPYLISKGGVIDPVSDRRPGIPLGVERNSAYRDVTRQLKEGDMVFLYSDGIPEAMNAEGVFFSQEKLRAHLREAHADSPREIITSLRENVSEFVGATDQYDDVTLFALRWHPDQLN